MAVSERVYEVRDITVTRFAGPGGAPMYQLTGPTGYVQLSPGELRSIGVLVYINDEEGVRRDPQKLCTCADCGAQHLAP